jgi:hypothetical protein
VPLHNGAVKVGVYFGFCPKTNYKQKVPEENSCHLRFYISCQLIACGFKEDESFYPFEVVVKQKKQNSYGRSLEEPSLKTFTLSISCKCYLVSLRSTKKMIL